MALEESHRGMDMRLWDEEPVWICRWQLASVMKLKDGRGPYSPQSTPEIEIGSLMETELMTDSKSTIEVRVSFIKIVYVFS